MGLNIIERLASAIGNRLQGVQKDDKLEPDLVTREHVICGYRLFLDRDPEDDLVIEEKLAAFQKTKELRTDFMLSPEFGLKNQELTLLNDSNIVIKELDDHLSPHTNRGF
jgi:hypothetical protein